MAETVSSHQVAAFSTPVNGGALDATVVRGNDNTLRTGYVAHDADPGIHLQSSALASRPAAGTAGRKWLSADTSSYRLFYDTGAAWQELTYLRTDAGGAITGNVSVTGTLGVGTASPAGKAHIVGANGNTLILDNDGSQYTEILLQNNGTTKAFWYWDESGSFSLLNATDRLDLSIGGTPLFRMSGTTVAVLGALTVSGNVTLGDASGDTLTVAPNAVTWSNNPTHSGNHTFSGSVTVGGTFTLDPSGSAASVESTTTQNVSTATTIFARGGATFGIAIVSGVSGTDRFTDIVSCASTTAVAVSSTTVTGSPAARTYSMSSNNLQLAMASGTYSVVVRGFAVG